MSQTDSNNPLTSHKQERNAVSKVLRRLDRSYLKAVASIMGFVVALVALYEWLGVYRYKFDEKWVLTYASFVQCVLIGGVFAYLSAKGRYAEEKSTSGASPQQPRKNDDQPSNKNGDAPLDASRNETDDKSTDNARMVQLLYRRYWIKIWLAWFFLYFVLIFLYWPWTNPTPENTQLVEQIKLAQNVLKGLATFFNNCATLGFSLCFSILDKPDHADSVDEQENFRNTGALLFVGLIVIAVIQIMCLADFKLWPNSILFNPHPGSVAERISWLASIFSSIVMAMFVGRIGSKYFDCPPSLLIMFYLYAAIQPLFGLFDDEKLWREVLVLMIAAITLKGALLYYMEYKLFRGGRLLFYIRYVRHLDAQVDETWKEFSTRIRKYGE